MRTLTDDHLAQLIAALQKISAMAPKCPVPDLEDMPDLDPDQVEGLCYDLGLFHVAEVAREALTAIGVTPAPGTASWYHDD